MKLALSLLLTLLAPATALADAQADALAKAKTAIENAAHEMSDRTNPPPPQAGEQYNLGAGKATAERGQACAVTVDQAIKAGNAPATKLRIRETDTTLIDGKKHCQAMIEYGTKLEELIVAAKAAKRAEIAKKYEAEGAKGARLELLIEYDDVYWYGKGCGEKLDDPKTLAKAVMLFQWMENSDGTHTIRKYLFNGNAVKAKTERTFPTEAAAYKGCY